MDEIERAYHVLGRDMGELQNETDIAAWFNEGISIQVSGMNSEGIIKLLQGCIEYPLSYRHDGEKERGNEKN